MLDVKCFFNGNVLVIEIDEDIFMFNMVNMVDVMMIVCNNVISNIVIVLDVLVVIL